MSVNYRLIHATPERLFDVLEDAWSYSAWVVGTSRVRAVSEGWPRPGSRLHHSFGPWPFVINDKTTSVAWERPRHAVVKARGGPLGHGEAVFDVQPHARGCVVRLTEDAISIPGRLVPRAIRDALGRVRNRETLRRLAYLAERRTEDEPGAPKG